MDESVSIDVTPNKHGMWDWRVSIWEDGHSNMVCEGMSADQVGAFMDAARAEIKLFEMWGEDFAKTTA